MHRFDWLAAPQPDGTDLTKTSESCHGNKEQSNDDVEEERRTLTRTQARSWLPSWARIFLLSGGDLHSS